MFNPNRIATLDVRDGTYTPVAISSFLLAAWIAWAGDYYHLFRNGAEIEQIVGNRVDSVKVTDGMIHFYEEDALLYSREMSETDSLTLAPVSTVQLLAPASDASANLNNTDSLSFSYTPAPGIEEYRLMIGQQEDLSDAMEIPLGNLRKRSFHADDLHDYLSAIGIDYAARPVYRTVAPDGKNGEGDIDKAAPPRKLTIRKRPKGRFNRICCITPSAIPSIRST